MPAEPSNSPKPKALPPAPKGVDSGEPGGGKGRVDLTGTILDDVRIDPEITEGYAGYEASGDSGLNLPGAGKSS
jgi:hypothetical protein